MKKAGGTSAWQHKAKQLWGLIEDLELFNIGYVGAYYTWTKFRSREANIMECLDRGFCNGAWNLKF